MSRKNTSSRTRAWGRAPRVRGALLLALLSFYSGCATLPSDDDPVTRERLEEKELPSDDAGWTKEQKAIALNVGIAAAVGAYGLQFWDYGGASFQFKDEGWFGKNTKFGGADKLGHAFTAYAGSIGFAALYEHWGYERERANTLGLYSSLGATTLIEVGDGLSNNGFSFQDLVMDAGGALFGYLRRRHPEIGRYVDFRVEYFPSQAVTDGGHTDLNTDYSGYKYLLAFKLAGFRGLEDTWLQYLEVQVGYFTRGFVTADADFYDDKSRNVYVGLGINFSRVFRKAGWKKTAIFLNFYQVPYTYVATGDYGR